MSRMGEYVLQMQEDAVELTEDAFITKYGAGEREFREQILTESYGPDYLQAMQDEEQQLQEDLQFAANDIPF
jgi:hypothetical protein